MNKHDFLVVLRDRLSGLPEKDIEDSIAYYSSSIDDRIESGKSEEEAVNDLGPIDDIIRQIKSDRPLKEVVKTSFAKSPLNTGSWALNVVLLILGFPLWFPLAVTALVLIIVAFFLVWLVPLIAGVVSVSCIAGGLWSLPSAIYNGFAYGPLPAFAIIGTGLIALGIGLFAGIGTYYLGKTFVGISGKLGRSIKSLFVR